MCDDMFDGFDGFWYGLALKPVTPFFNDFTNGRTIRRGIVRKTTIQCDISFVRHGDIIPDAHNARRHTFVDRKNAHL